MIHLTLHTPHTSHFTHLTQTDGLVSDYSNLPSTITASGEFVYENPFLMSTTLQSTTRNNTYDNTPQHANYDNTNVLETDVMTMVSVGVHPPPSVGACLFFSPSSLPSLSLSSLSLFLLSLPSSLSPPSPSLSSSHVLRNVSTITLLC